MKKILINVITPQLVSFVILSLSMVAFFTSCQKTAKQPELSSAQVETSPIMLADQNKRTQESQPPVRTVATIAYNDGRQLGAFDWYIKLYKGQWEVLANLPNLYRKNGLVVDVTYVPTNERVKTLQQTPKYMMKILDIRLVTTGATILNYP